MKALRLPSVILSASTALVLMCAGWTPTMANTDPGLQPEPLGQYLELPPGERYRQLTFLLYLTDGVDPALVEFLDSRRGEARSAPATVTDVENYQGAGFRIASSESILNGTADLVKFRQLTEPLILEELASIEAQYPDLTRMVNKVELAQDAILVRSAVADSVETLHANGELPSAELLAVYREHTLRIRNDLEFLQFAREMDLLTAEHIEETTARLEAFHRMVDDDYDMAFLREQIDAVDAMNEALSTEHRMWAMMRTTRLLMMLLPVINRYYYYR